MARSCRGFCTDTTSDPFNCGECFATCALSTICQGGQCVCPGATVLCGSVCRDLYADDANCGACGAACAPGSHCVTGTCLAHPVAPPSGSTVTTASPVFRWSPGDGVAQVCTDRDCAHVVATVSVDRSAPTAPLPPGHYYWRVGTPTGHAWGPVWGLTVSPHRTTPGTAQGWARDFDGRGSAALLVGAPGSVSVLVYSAGLGAAPDDLSAPDGGISTGFGHVLLRVGDFNGDGYGDLVAPSYTNAWIFPGGPAGIDPGHSSVLPVTSPAMSLAAIGDVNGDGYADMVSGDPTVDQISLWLGGPTGFEGTGARIARERGSRFGIAMAGVGDVDGDGYPDVAIGAPGATSLAGRVYVYFGSGTGLDRTALLERPPGAEVFGDNVEAVGDINGDGYNDVLVGWPGHAAVYDGGAEIGTVSATIALPPGTNAPPSAAGDVNGDGYADLLVARSDLGQGLLYPGSPSGPAAVPVLLAGAAWRAADGPVLAAGDLDGDGYDDVAIGAVVTHGVVVFFGGATGPLTRSVTVTDTTHGEFGTALAWGGARLRGTPSPGRGSPVGAMARDRARSGGARSATGRRAF